MKRKSFQTGLVIITALAVLVVISYTIAHNAFKKEEIQISCLGNPSIGNPLAKAHLILFEDVSCYNCQVFIRAIFPTIKKKYIDTGKAKITIIPLAFLKGSNIPSNAELCVYSINPDRYYNFIQKLHNKENGLDSSTVLLKHASEIGGIDLPQLRQCIKQNFYYNQLQSNLECGKEIMGRKFGTPTLYVNGVNVKHLTIEAISKEIERNL